VTVLQPVDSSILHEIVRIIESRRKVPERLQVRSREYQITYLEDHQRRLEEALHRFDSDQLNMLYGQLASKVKYQMLRRVPARPLPAKKEPAARGSAAKAKAKKAAGKKPAAKKPAAKKPAGKKPAKRARAAKRAPAKRGAKKQAARKTTTKKKAPARQVRGKKSGTAKKKK
jgi:hypothetical protein